VPPSGKIEHVVIVFQENRTPDNLFQDPVLIAKGADIATSGLNSKGATIQLTPIDLGTTGTKPQNYDLSHAHAAFVAMYDGGKMDGADLIGCTPAIDCPPNAHPNPQFKYVLPSDVQPYFALAEQYTFGDRMFQTNQGPSYPAHQYLIAGTSEPSVGSDLLAAENPIKTQDRGFNTAGCGLSPPEATIAMINPPNLHIIIMDNGGYQITGSQPAATKYDTDLVAMARGAGLKNSQWVDDETAFEAFVDAALRSKEPTLAGAKIDMKAAVATTERNPFRIRDNFTRGIAPDS